MPRLKRPAYPARTGVYYSDGGKVRESRMAPHRHTKGLPSRCSKFPHNSGFDALAAEKNRDSGRQETGAPR